MRSDQKPVNALVTVCVLVSIAIAASADTWYVDAGANPGGDGTTWGTAFNRIQQGIDASSHGDDIVIADGTYTGDGNRDISFNGKAITVRSLNGPENCIIDCEATNETPHRGFRFASNESESSILQGFTIQHGGAPEETPQDMYINSYGGAIFICQANPIIRDCRFINNMTWPFTDNRPVRGCGGAVSCIHSSARLENCEFLSNSAPDGGGLYVANSTMEVWNCSFLANKADRISGAPETLAMGGAIKCELNSSLTIANCQLIGNVALGMGSMGDSIYCPAQSEVYLINSIVSANYGPMYIYGSITATNCSFIENHLPSATSAFEFKVYGNALLQNCIVWGAPGSTSNPIRLYNTGTTTITYSNIQNGWEGEGNIDAQPLFVRLPDDGGDGWYNDPLTPELDETVNNDYGNLQLLPGSPGIDAGNNESVPAEITLDLAGNPRFMDEPDTEDTGYGTAPIVDMGAYEYQARVLNVNPAGTADYPTIQAAIDASTNGDTILCQDGTYTGDGNRDISFNGKAITVRSLNGPEYCIIDCEATNETPHRGFRFSCGESESSILQGFTIQHGGAPEETPPDMHTNSYGGAIYICQASPIIRDCHFANNMTFPLLTNRPCRGYGGGVTCIYSSACIEDCEFFSNSARDGGGLFIENSTIDVRNSSFLVNRADGITATPSTHYRGGAIKCEPNSVLTVTNCQIIGNVGVDSNGSGASIYTRTQSELFITNSIVSANHGPMYIRGSMTAINCSFIDNNNTSVNIAKELYIYGNAILKNCVVWGHPGAWNNPISLLHTGIATITYSNIQNGWDGEGNIDAQPLFVRHPDGGEDGWFNNPRTPEIDETVNNDYGNLQLLLGSPGIDAGNNESVPTEITLDLAGDPRFFDDPLTPDTGYGTAPIVDMGAYEYQARVLNVNPEGTSDYPTIQAAIDASTNGDTVLCHDGTYTGDGNRDISFNGKAIIVMSLNGPNNCIIDCEATSDSPHRGFRFTELETKESVLDGFTITNGLAPEEEPEGSGINKGYGGAIYLSESSPIIRNCHMISNRSDFGGAVSCFDSSPVFEQCILEYNDSRRAGGVYINSSSLKLRKCEFYCNQAIRSSPAGGMTYGGGICSESDTSLTMTDCIIIGNNAYGMNSSGSSIYSDMTSTVRMVNSCLAANEGGLHCSGELIAINCTFYGNTSTYPDRNREIICSGGSIDLVNCIAWGTPEISESPIWLTLGAVAQITYSNIQNGWEGDRNINQPPLITRNPDDGGDGWYQSSGPDLNNDYGDLRLLPGSPGIDVGKNSAVPAEITLDLAGIPRFFDDPDSEDPIYSMAPVVDMGAYEYDPTNGNWDRDGDVDLQDFAAFQICLNSADAQCIVVFDLDADLDIDLDDFLLFEGLITGPR